MDEDEPLPRHNMLYLLAELERAIERAVELSAADLERAYRRLMRLAEMTAEASRKKAN